MVSTSHHSYNGGAKALMDRIKQLSSQKVCVGVPGEDSERENSDVSNADLVYIHTHGVRPPNVRAEMQTNLDKGKKYSVALQMYIHEHGSFAYQVPPRPIIEPAIENSKEDIGEKLGDAAKVAMDGKDIRKALVDVGNEAQQDVQDWFVNPKNGWAPNAESTVKKKKSENPLIDTGALRKAINFVIRGEEDD